MICTNQKFLLTIISIICFHILVKIILNEYSSFSNQFRRKIILSELKLINKNDASRMSATEETSTDRKTTVTKNLTVADENNISCYNESTHVNGLKEFDYSGGKESPKFGRSIFLLETSCFGEEGLQLNARQACAVESAARMHPTMDVYFLYLCPLQTSESAEILFHQLLSYENIKIRRINVEQYIKNTPLEKWYASGILKTSYWKRIHMSDILRFFTLWKYRGIYLDLDVVIRKPLDDMENFAGAEDATYVAIGLMGFGIGNLGQRIADSCLEELITNFNGHIWGHNGPILLTRVLQKICNATLPHDMTSDRCQGFTVLAQSSFYPILHVKYKKYFETKDKVKTLKIIENAKAIHVYNKLSHEEKIKVGSNVPYEIVAQQYCPKVYFNCGEFF